MLKISTHKIDALIEHYDWSDMGYFKYHNKYVFEVPMFCGERPIIKKGSTKLCFIFKDITVKTYLRHPDYCDIEYNNYLLAKEQNLEMFFPETRFYKEFDGRKFFIQETAQEVDRVRNKTDDTRVQHYMSEYPESDVKRLIDFLHENKINDLRCENFGTIDGRHVIIDFSGILR